MDRSGVARDAAHRSSPPTRPRACGSLAAVEVAGRAPRRQRVTEVGTCVNGSGQDDRGCDQAVADGAVE